jgi:hypothetical protein
VSHEAEHEQLRATIERQGYGLDTLHARLLVHFGSKHHYQPHVYENDGAAVLLGWHDVVHATEDVLGVERHFDADGLATLADCRRRYREAAARDA